MLLKQSFIITDKTRKDSVTNQYNNLPIITLNVNKLFDDDKRQQVFQFLEDKNAEIILLQETCLNPGLSGLYIIKKWKSSGNENPSGTLVIRKNLQVSPKRKTLNKNQSLLNKTKNVKFSS